MRALLAALAVAAIAGCHGGASTKQAITPNTQSHPTQWSYVTVNAPGGNTVITGINNLGKIVGFTPVAASTSGSGAYAAFASVPPYKKFVAIAYPGATSTQALALSNTDEQSGAYHSAAGPFGFIRSKAGWKTYPLPVNGINRILCGGHNCHGHVSPGNLLAVGPAQDGTGGYLLDTVTGAQTDLLYPAAGINGKGHIVGNAGPSVGIFLFYAGKYTNYAYPAAQQTIVNAINWQDQLAGTYTDSASVTHGFILSIPRTASPVRQSIDAPKATGGTWLWSINDHVQLAGSYKDATGIHGFVATPTN